MNPRIRRIRTSRAETAEGSGGGCHPISSRQSSPQSLNICTSGALDGLGGDNCSRCRLRSLNAVGGLGALNSVRRCIKFSQCCLIRCCLAHRLLQPRQENRPDSGAADWVSVRLERL